MCWKPAAGSLAPACGRDLRQRPATLYELCMTHELVWSFILTCVQGTGKGSCFLAIPTVISCSFVCELSARVGLLERLLLHGHVLQNGYWQYHTWRHPSVWGGQWLLTQAGSRVCASSCGRDGAGLHSTRALLGGDLLSAGTGKGLPFVPSAPHFPAGWSLRCLHFFRPHHVQEERQEKQRCDSWWQ